MLMQVEALTVDGLLANIHFFRVRDYVEQVGPMWAVRGRWDPCGCLGRFDLYVCKEQVGPMWLLGGAACTVLYQLYCTCTALDASSVPIYM